MLRQATATAESSLVADYEALSLPCYRCLEFLMLTDDEFDLPGEILSQLDATYSGFEQAMLLRTC